MQKKIAAFLTLLCAFPVAALATSGKATEKVIQSISDTTFIYLFISLFVLGLIAYFGIYFKKTFITAKYAKIYLWLIIIAGLAGRLILAYNTKGFPNDIASFQSWAGSAAKDFIHFYSSGANGGAAYTPAYIYVLAVVGFFMKQMGTELTGEMAQLFVKIPSILADLGIALLIYYGFKDKFTVQVRIAFVLLITLNPLLIYNSSVWGQVDSILVLLLAVVAVFMVKNENFIIQKMKINFNNIYIATFFMAVAILYKPQAIFFFPMLAFELLRRFSIKNILTWIRQVLISAAVGFGTFFGLCLPFVWPAKSAAFSLGGSPLWIFNLYLNASESLKYASISSLNFFGMLGKNWVTEKEIFLFGKDYFFWGNTFMVLGYVVTAALFFLGVWKKLLPKDDLSPERKNFKVAAAIFLAPILMNVGFFIFGARMHERYMIPAAILLIFAYAHIKDIRVLIAFIGFSITNFANLMYVLSLPREEPWMRQQNIFVIGLSTVNVILAALIFYTAFDILILNRVFGEKWIFRDEKINKAKKR